MKNPLVERPWLLIVAGLAAFVGMWVTFLVIAELKKPASVPVVERPSVSPTPVR